MSFGSTQMTTCQGAAPPWNPRLTEMRLTVRRISQRLLYKNASHRETHFQHHTTRLMRLTMRRISAVQTGGNKKHDAETKPPCKRVDE